MSTPYIHDEFFQALRGRGLLSDIEKMAKARSDVVAIDTLPTDTGWQVEVRTHTGSFKLARSTDKIHLAVARHGLAAIAKEYPCQQDGLVEASIDFLSAFLRSTPRK